MSSPRKPPVPLFQRALIALHGTAQDGDLLTYASMLARLEVIGELHFVHVVPEPPSPDNFGQHERLAAQLRAETSKHVGGLPARVTIRHELRHGALLDQLLEYATAEQADLVMVGHRQDHPLRRSLARRLAKLAPCSVWLVPQGSAASLKRVLVPIDFSAAAANALSMAVRVSTLFGLSELTAVHVYFDEARTTFEGAEDVIRGHETSSFDAFMAPIDTCGVQVRPLFREGVHPAHAIRHVADELAVDLIVMETRGRSRSAAILLGSVAQETLVDSRVPVLVVKHPGAQVGLARAILEKLFRDEPGTQFD